MYVYIYIYACLSLFLNYNSTTLLCISCPAQLRQTMPAALRTHSEVGAGTKK